MSHLEERTSDLVDGRLGAAETESAHAHLAVCAACFEMVEAERLTKARLSALEAPAPAQDFLARLLAVPAAVSPDSAGESSTEASRHAPLDAAAAPVTRPAPGRPAEGLSGRTPGSRRPGSSSRPGGAPDSVRPGAGRLARPARRPARARLAAAMAGSVGMLGAGLFALSVVSPSANAALTPGANLSLARTVITMTGLPIVNALPGRWLGGSPSGR